MLIYLNDKIYDTDKAEVTDETERPEHGYFNEAIEYKAQDGEIFCVRRSKFSNILDSVWGGKLEKSPDVEADSEDLPHYFDFECGVNPNNEWDIEDLKEQIDDAEDEKEIEELKKELIKLEEEQKDYDNIIPDSAEMVLDFDNIGMGACTSQDFNYQSYVVYRDGDNYFLKNNTYENEYIGEVCEDEVVALAAWANKMWGYETGLEYIVENLDDFGWEETNPGVYEEALSE